MMDEKICWIETISYENADEHLRAEFDRCRGPNGQLDNLYKAYSLMPHALGPADDLYKAVLHNPANVLPAWQAELIATFVAVLDGCEYAKSHHSSNFLHLHPNLKQANQILKALEVNDDFDELDENIAALLIFARILSQSTSTISEAELGVLRDKGYGDRELLEIIQIVACFAYFTRVINGLGIDLGGEKSGHYGDFAPPHGQK